MSTTRVRRIGRREAEELLSGAPAAADRDALVRLLDLAAAPAQPAELVGREAAVRAISRAYRDAVRDAQTRRRHRHRRRSLLSRALAAKAFAGLTVLTLGGVAVAATTGSLPSPVQHGAHDLLSPLGVTVPDSRATRPAEGREGPHPSATPSPSPTTGTGPPVDPAMQGLCQVWQAQQKGHTGKSMEATAFQTLVTAAGGAGKVPAFCAAVLAQPHSGAPPSAKGRPAKPSATPHKASASPPPSHPDRVPATGLDQQR
jgi:hypothetical protein